jgi:Flp pilus assembly protein TadG
MICGLQHEKSALRTQIPPVCKSCKSRERGSSLVEQSFVLVFLLTLLFGIIDFGRALYTYHFVSNVAREATRWASVRSSKCTVLPECPGDTSGKDVQKAFKGNKANLAAMGIDSTKLTFNTKWVAPQGASTAFCTAPGNVVGCMVHVDVSYSYTFLFGSFIAAPPLTISSSSEMLVTK